MKSWSLKELEKTLPQWNFLIGARLQKVVYHPKKVLFLEWFNKGPNLMFIDLRRPNCFVGILPELRPPKKVKKDTPISLFLKSNFQDRSLIDVELCREFGRVLRLKFSDTDYLELRLFPKDVNLIAVANAKQISYEKPKELFVVEDNYEPKEYRDLFKASEDWWQEFQEKKENLSGKIDPEVLVRKELKKLQKQKEKTLNSKEKLESENWKEMAKWFQENQSTQFPEEWKTNFKGESFTHWSYFVDFCFESYKKKQGKLEGVLKRLADLDSQMAKIEGGEHDFSGQKSFPVKKTADLQAKTGAKTKSKNISADLRIHIGRSAKENVLLLRKAKPWFLWMHLKDLPGNHLIVEKNKNRELKHNELILAAKELVQLKKQFLAGESFEVQYAECRYIKPIKGDKLGRVKVTNEKVILVSL